MNKQHLIYELSRIEDIKVSNCKKLRHIISFSEVDLIECNRRKVQRKFELLVLKSLHELILSYLLVAKIKMADKNENSFPLGFLVDAKYYSSIITS